MKIALVNAPGARSLPAATSIAIYNLELGRRLAAAGDSVSIFGSPLGERSDGAPAVRHVPDSADWRLQRLVGPIDRLTGPRLPLFASRAYFPFYFRRIARQLAATGCDVVHLHDFIGAVPTFRRLLPDSVLVLHLNGEWLSAAPTWLVRRSAMAADVIAAPSRHVIDRIGAALPDLPGRLEVFPNGVDTSRFAPVEGTRDAPPPRLIAVGRISPEKGIHLMLAALALLLDDLPDLRLALVGKEAPLPPALLIDLSDDDRVRALRRFYPPPYLQPLLDATEDRVRAAVELVGELDHDATAARYREASAVVNASLSESFGMSAVEGMAAGLPVVASRVGGLPEVLVDGETGILVAPDDPAALATALRQVLVDPALRERLGEEGRRVAVERFDWSVLARQVREAYLRAGAAA